MWAIGRRCPEFSVRTPAGVVGPADLRPAWLALLHCTRPCTPGCGGCLVGVRRLGRRLGQRGCRLLVALDRPDAELRALLARMPADRRAPVLVGSWETPEPRHAPSTLFAVIDPHGTLRAVLQQSNATPLPEGVLLEQVDRALGRPSAAAASRAVPPAECFGCVDWFDYDSSDRRAPVAARSPQPAARSPTRRTSPQ
jgi:hypothetical protein